MDEEKILMFEIAGKEFAIDIKEVDRILSHNNITFVPEKEYFIEGIIDYEDRVLTVINLAKLFSMEEDEEEESTIIIAVVNESKLALKVNHVSRIIDLPKAKKESIPDLAFKHDSFFSSVVKVDDRIRIVLSIEKLIELDSI
ncbi:MAG: chemotaxis protein CheW [Sarcina sp.]